MRVHWWWRPPVPWAVAELPACWCSPLVADCPPAGAGPPWCGSGRWRLPGPPARHGRSRQRLAGAGQTGTAPTACPSRAALGRIRWSCLPALPLVSPVAPGCCLTAVGWGWCAGGQRWGRCAGGGGGGAHCAGAGPAGPAGQGVPGQAAPTTATCGSHSIIVLCFVRPG